MAEVNISERIELKNGESFYLIEKSSTKSNKVDVSKSSSSFKIKSVPVALGTAGIILTKGTEYIGHISAIIYPDNTAALYMNEIRNIILPEEISNIDLEDKALVVNEKYRGQRKSKELIYLMLNYLVSKGITTLYVNGITDEVALRTYLSTNAVQLSDNKAVYYDLNNILQSNIFDELFKENLSR